MKRITSQVLTYAIIVLVSSLAASGESTIRDSFDAGNFRYRGDSRSVFNSRNAKEAQRVDAFIEKENKKEYNTRHTATFRNPDPMLSIPPVDVTGDLEAPDGEIWSYTGNFEYLEIPPHDNVVYTQRLLQEYTFTIYDADMNVVGTIKDKIHYKDGEKRAPLCELLPVITRNFFNTDDEIELMVGVGINPAQGYGVHYHSYVYSLIGEKDENGYDIPIMTFDSLVNDIIEGPRSADGSDNFYFTFSGDTHIETRDDSSFWDRLVSMKSILEIYGKALDDKGPRVLHRYSVPLLSYPGDQENVPPMISVRHGDDVYFLMQKYKEPFYNRYDNPMEPDLTQREGNSLLIDIFKASEEGVILSSSSEIPVKLDPMPDAEGMPTVLFSYFSVGNLRYRGDILFDAPGTSEGKPDFIITRSNYRPSSDGTVNSYFTYHNDGSLKNTLCLYSAGSRAMGAIDGYEPQQVFVQRDAYGYTYQFVDIYSARIASEIEANYYIDDDSEPEILSFNCDRTPCGDSYVYAFEMRYPIVDDNENDILRFMYINPDGSYNHTDYVNMGKGVVYAQSYIATEALKPNVYSVSDAPSYMMLIKRGVEGSYRNIEELMVAEAMTEENPEGKTLLLVGPKEDSILTSIVPEFADGDRQGRLFIYYYDSPKSLLSLDIYGLPLNADTGGVRETEYFDNSSIEIQEENISGQGIIRVFTTDGKLVASGLNHLDLSSLAKGLYIVTTPESSIKFVK